MKNLSVALLAATAIASVSSAVANGNGFYAGLSAGVAQTNAKYDYQKMLDGKVVSGSGKNVFAADSGKAGGLYGVFAGFGSLINNFYIGGEVYGGFDTTKFSPFDDNASGSDVATWKTQLEHKNYYGLAARFGVMATPSTLLYVRLAMESGKWTAKLMPNGDSIDAGGIGTADQRKSSKQTVTKNKKGIQFSPGVGAEIYMNRNFFVRAEYSYLFGPKITFDQDVKGGPIGGADLVRHKLKTSQHRMMVSVGYKF